jgi:hypothetical protein
MIRGTGRIIAGYTRSQGHGDEKTGEDGAFQLDCDFWGSSVLAGESE